MPHKKKKRTLDPRNKVVRTKRKKSEPTTRTLPPPLPPIPISDPVAVDTLPSTVPIREANKQLREEDRLRREIESARASQATPAPQTTNFANLTPSQVAEADLI